MVDPAGGRKTAGDPPAGSHAFLALLLADYSMQHRFPILLVALLAAPLVNSQVDSRARYKADVNMVVQTFSVTDKSGNHVTGLKPADIRIFEDGIPQKLAAFAEGSTLFRLLDNAPGSPGTAVFLLFDTSNRMYTSYPYVRDAIAEFIRRLAPTDSAALYTFSRNLFRAAPLTRDHIRAGAGLDNISAGDDSALFNALLLTLRDAAQVPGPKEVVVFSNSPDNASMLSPYDVARVAVNEGIPVYVISTRDAVQDPVMFDALQYLTVTTGGKLYCARNWQKQAVAFQSIREDIGNSYTAYYYPAPNPNQGFRNIKIEVVTPGGHGLHVLARPGYEPRKELSTRAN
jgi:VWFA-related protein